MRNIITTIVFALGMLYTAQAQFYMAVDNDPNDQYQSRTYAKGTHVKGLSGDMQLNVSHQSGDLEVYFNHATINVADDQHIRLSFIFDGDKSTLIKEVGATTNKGGGASFLWNSYEFSRKDMFDVIEGLKSSNIAHVRFELWQDHNEDTDKDAYVIRNLGVVKFNLNNSNRFITKVVDEFKKADDPFADNEEDDDPF